MEYFVEEIGKEFFIISSPEEGFNRNIYLKRFISSDRKNRVNMLFDPGTPLDYEYLFKILKELVGGVNKIDLIFISHQDPDLTSNLKTFLTANPNLTIIGSIDTFRLVKMYGIPDRNFKGVETLKSYVAKISKTGHMLQFVPAYYCHFRGAMMAYDYESRVLFSGDFLAGLKVDKGNGIYANKDSFKGIAMFHEIYMPTKKAMLLTIDRIGFLNPLPEVVAPQHGFVIKGDLISDFLTKLTQLDVGVDLLEFGETKKDEFLNAINSFMNSLKNIDLNVYSYLLNDLKKVGEFTTMFTFSGDIITDYKLLPQDSVDHIINILLKLDNGEEYASLLVNTLINFGLIDKLPKLKLRGSEKPVEESIFD